ncbi:MAG TPA: tetratricopeptide repeat protein [Gemmatimonadales bacterium]|nr:tetratricopeptide repeat protein [Gemmatimonadales bacterium]
MNLEKLKDAARKFEQKEDWRRAIEVYQKAIVEFESGQDPNPDLSIYNRVGDLYMKANDPAAAVQAYERAVDLYSDQGFLNNAIALCGKILRVNPGRIQAYLKLAQLHARKNVVHDAKKNLIEYLERMNQVHQLEEAFKAVKAFADQFPGNQEIRLMLSDLLRASSRTTEAREQLEKLTEDLEARGDAIGARRTRERLQAINEEDAEPKIRQRKNDLVFLDIGVDVKTPAKPATPPPPPRRSTVRVARPTVRTTPMIAPEVMIDDGIVSPAPPSPPAAEAEPAPLEIETSSLADEDLDLASLSTKEAMSDLLRADDAVAPPEVMPDLEPTIFEAGDAADSIGAMDGLLVDSEASLDLEQSTSILDDPATLDATVEQLEGVESSDALIVEESSGEMIDVADEILDVAELDDGTDWDIPEELVQQPETVVAATVVDGTPEASLAFLQVEEPVQPSIEELEDRILDDPDNPESHRALGEALLAAGDSVRGIDELDLALLGYENREDWEHALDLIRELIQVDPTSVRYYQKRVEVAYRTGDKDRLIVAYLELGDALVRTGALDKALAVYRRVAEHEPDNTRAQTALMTLAPPEEPVPTAPASTSRATPKSAPAPVENGDFIDLGMLVREEAGAAKDTRMRVEDEEPTGDEERDFKDMLSQFKRGIEQNLDSEDFQSHYDLGVAYKEMGLLDEAIAEFQKALRSPENRLRTSEALGVCFFEKNQPAIAEAILRRAVDSQAGGDDQKIGLLYWLGRSFEAQNKVEEALGIYRRVMAVDIQFGDLADRVSALNAGRVG